MEVLPLISNLNIPAKTDFCLNFRSLFNCFSDILILINNFLEVVFSKHLNDILTNNDYRVIFFQWKILGNKRNV